MAVTGGAEVLNEGGVVREEKSEAAEPGKGASRRWKRPWSARQRQFLETLATTHNVAAAAAAAEITVTAVRAFRAKEPAFALQWEEALAMAREQLREDLFAHALGGCDRGAKATAFDPQLAMKVLALWDSQGGGGRPAIGKGAPSQATIDATLLKRLDGLADRRGG